MKKIYYGWILVPFASLGVIMSIPGQTAGFSAFTEPLLSFSGISRTALSTAYLVGTLSSGFILPFMGKIVDRVGSRIMMVISALCMGLTLLMMSQINQNVAILGSVFHFSDIKILYFAAFVFGIFCLRFFGQGMFPLVSNTMVGKWFEKYRGRAVAFMGAANSLAFAAAPAVMSALVTKTGWSQAWLILAGVLGIGMTLIALLVYRKNPESCGLHVDGITPDHADEKQDGNAPESEINGMTLKQARKTWIFWFFGIALGIHALIITGFTFHIQAIGKQAGMLVDTAVAIFIPVSFITVPLGFTASWLSSRIPYLWYLRALCFGEILAYTSIYFMNSSAGYVLAIVGMGIAGGLMGPILSTIVPKIFGRKHLGAINGTFSSIVVIGSALGPLYLSMVSDFIGFFISGILFSIILPIMILILTVLIGRKRLLTLA